MSVHVFDPFNDLCPFCLDELRAGVPDDGKCGHEKLLEQYPHLRFNASQHLDEATLRDSWKRFRTAYTGGISNS
jgi:hypothetical protein